MRQRTAAPTKKVAVGGVTSAVAALLVYAVATLWHLTIPPDVAMLAAGLIVGAAGWLAAYLTPASPEDAPVPAARRRRDPLGH
jgi:hypothetical protein